MKQGKKYQRSSGFLLHPTALPNAYGIGGLGNEARRFCDFLVLSGQTLWQICPLGPTGYGDSPYQCFSAFAGNPLLIDVESLVGLKLLEQKDLDELQNLPGDAVDFGELIPLKEKVLRSAFHRFHDAGRAGRTGKLTLLGVQFDDFKSRSKEWLEDFALFMVCKSRFDGEPWYSWDHEVKFRDPSALESIKKDSAQDLEYQRFVQFLFFSQYSRLRGYVNANGIRMIGDMPIFVAHDSVDVWARPELFLLDEERKPTVVAGVPPDYFSKTGQLWGNPIFNWDYMKKNGFRWWLRVLEHKLSMYDYLRIDHFRGFAGYWAVPFGEETAIHGEWRPAPGKELFACVRETLGDPNILAEDLGVITPEVKELLLECGFPGMKVLQFAFDSSEENDHLPHNYDQNCVVYTGTHDNDTTPGWFEKALPKDRALALAYLKSDGSEVQWDFIRSALSSTAVFSVFPMQDVLGLGSEARFNTPGTPSGNWRWRMNAHYYDINLASRIRKLAKLYGR